MRKRWKADLRKEIAKRRHEQLLNLVIERDRKCRLYATRVETMETHLYAALNKIGDRVEVTVEEIMKAPKYLCRMGFNEDGVPDRVIFDKEGTGADLTLAPDPEDAPAAE